MAKKKCKRGLVSADNKCYRKIEFMGDSIPPPSTSYIKQKIINKDNWSNLFTNKAVENLEGMVRRHYHDELDLGANITHQRLEGFEVTDEMLTKLRHKYKWW